MCWPVFSVQTAVPMYTLHFHWRLCAWTLAVVCVGVARGDVSHIMPQEFGFFAAHHQQHQHQHPHYSFHVPAFVVPQPVAPPAPPPPSPAPTPLPTLYSVPSTPPTSASDVGYPQAPPPVTHAPVAPTRPAATTTASTTTEFTLPEIVENRSHKQQHHLHNFIPLNNIFGGGSSSGGGGGTGGVGATNYYLPPPLDAQPPSYESPVGGYFYPRPTTTTTTTTTPRPRPIVVAEPPLLLPPPSDTPLNVGGLSYDYNASVGPVFTLPPPPQRPSTPAPAYLPPSTALSRTASAGENANAVHVEHVDPHVPPLRVSVQELRCLQPGADNSGGYFRSVLRLNSFISATPTIEDAHSGVGENGQRCQPRLARSLLVLDVTEADFAHCGVRTCGRDLCVRLRFPALRGMRTGWDSILTLHCKAQDRVAIKTHALKMGVNNEAQARSLGTYARGGTQNQFRTHIELLRRSASDGSGGGGYTRLLDTTNGNAVQLGEELLLRAHVVPGDGWNYTRLSDVSLQRISPAGELLNSANLITPQGCLNPVMQSVCSEAPIFEPPLGQRLTFRAVMFQGMHSGDELVLSMRITACLSHNDCQVRVEECSNGGGGASGEQLHRRRRAIDGLTMSAAANDTEVSEMSRIAFRVLMPEDGGRRVAQNNAESAVTSEIALVPQRTLALVGSLLFVAALAFVGLFAHWQLKLKR